MESLFGRMKWHEWLDLGYISHETRCWLSPFIHHVGRQLWKIPLKKIRKKSAQSVAKS